MTTLDINNIRNEISNCIRNGDVLGATSTTIRGVTTQTDSFTATAGQTAFQLTKTSVHNVRSVTVNAVSKYYVKDYTFVAATGILTLNTGAGIGETVAVSYDYRATEGDKIYPDMPRDDLSLTSYPRVGIEITSEVTTPLGLGGTSHISDFMITIFCWMPVNKDTSIAGGLGGTADLSTVMKNIRAQIRAQAKNFSSNIPYIYPSGLSPITKSINNKIIQQGEDFIIKFIVE